MSRPEETMKKKLVMLRDAHGRPGLVHELDCPWVNGVNQNPAFRSKYRIVDAREVRGWTHARCC